MRRTQILTAREDEILTLIESGMRNKAVADSCGIACATVKVHVLSIRNKLGATPEIRTCDIRKAQKPFLFASPVLGVRGRCALVPSNVGAFEGLAGQPAEELLRLALPVLQMFARENPVHSYGGQVQDPVGVHALLKRLAAYTNQSFPVTGGAESSTEPKTTSTRSAE